MGNRIHFGMILILLFSSMVAQAGEFTIRETTIIGTGTPVPGSNGMFQRFGVTSRPVSPPASHEGSVVFWGGVS